MSQTRSLVSRSVKAVIAAALLTSAAAHAGPSRGLSLASAEAPSPSQTHQPAADVPPPSPAATTPGPAPDVKEVIPAESTAVAKPAKRHIPAAEARIIYELHRHGIYW
jgi:hypothetical protein